MGSKTLVIGLLLFSGCANQSPKPATTDLLAKPLEDKAVLVTYRKAIKPDHFAVENFIDGKSLGELRNRQFSWSYLEPGEYTLKTRWHEGALIPSTERTLTLEAKKYYLVEMRGGVGVAVLFKSREFKPTGTSLAVGDFAEAVKLLDGCCQLIEKK